MALALPEAARCSRSWFAGSRPVVPVSRSAPFMPRLHARPTSPSSPTAPASKSHPSGCRLFSDLRTLKSDLPQKQSSRRHLHGGCACGPTRPVPFGSGRDLVVVSFGSYVATGGAPAGLSLVKSCKTLARKRKTFLNGLLWVETGRCKCALENSLAKQDETSSSLECVCAHRRYPREGSYAPRRVRHREQSPLPQDCRHFGQCRRLRLREDAAVL